MGFLIVDWRFLSTMLLTGMIMRCQTGIREVTFAVYRLVEKPRINSDLLCQVGIIFFLLTFGSYRLSCDMNIIAVVIKV